MDSTLKTDILIIGGGASGIAAAIEAKKTAPEADVMIAERLDRTGKKILVTGSGRCNLTNRNITENDYHGTVRGVIDIIRKTGDTEEFFRTLGMLTVSDDEGRVYPYSRSAASVLSALRMKLKNDGIEETCSFTVIKIEKNQNGYTVISEDGRKIICRRIIAACGGYASPANGTDGRALKMFRDMGYRTEKICPAVAPLKVSAEVLKGLKGVRVHGKVTALSGGKALYSESGEIQFTENTVSGICVFNLAYLFSQYEGKLTVSADFMPEKDYDEVVLLLDQIKKIRENVSLEEMLNGIFVKNLAVYIMKHSVKRPLTDTVNSLSASDIRKTAALIKGLEFNITGCSSWQNAQVTSGGISGLAVDSKLRSLKNDGIYFAGEILDVDGRCGGYNLEWAWSSGKWAGFNCAMSLLKKT